MIYFMQSQGGGPVKIGHSLNVEARRKGLEAHYGTPLIILATRPGGRSEEAEMHARFAHLRLGRTEQFRPAPDLMKFIGRPLFVGANSDSVEALPVAPNDHLKLFINLKGDHNQIEWLNEASRRTHIPKSTIIRLALSMWGQANGAAPFPEKGST